VPRAIRLRRAFDTWRVTARCLAEAGESEADVARTIPSQLLVRAARLTRRPRRNSDESREEPANQAASRISQLRKSAADSKDFVLEGAAGVLTSPVFGAPICG
jgi:hypothetical protein